MKAPKNLYYLVHTVNTPEMRFVDEIINKVVDVLKIEKYSLFSKSRKRDNVEARAVIWTILKLKRRSWSSVKLGALFFRDHATALHGMNLAKEIPEIQQKIRRVMNEL